MALLTKELPPGSVYAPLPDSTQDGHVTAHAVQTILADPRRLYDLWRDLSLIPRWQERVVSVTATSDRTSHWVMADDPADPASKRLEFDSEITGDIPGGRLSWRSTGGDIEQQGAVTFEPVANGGGTLVMLIQTVKMPGGKVGNAVAAVAKRGPKQTVIENLRHFKQLAETGEIPSVSGQPHGPRGLSGGIKEWMYGETNPTPPGTTDQA